MDGDDPTLLEVLREVIDPELGFDIVELGLVYQALRAGTVAQVTMTLTSAACPLAEHVVRDVTYRPWRLSRRASTSSVLAVGARRPSSARHLGGHAGVRARVRALPRVGPAVPRFA